MRKRERQATIQRLIQDEPIERQEDLVARLNELQNSGHASNHFA